MPSMKSLLVDNPDSSSYLCKGLSLLASWIHFRICIILCLYIACMCSTVTW